MLGDFENTLLVGDEVHWLGATAFRPALISGANFRLGLSATPAVRTCTDCNNKDAKKAPQKPIFLPSPIAPTIIEKIIQGKKISIMFSFYPPKIAK
jgi:hypothetical protein